MGKDRKVIQIVTGAMGILALCDDGTVWQKTSADKPWMQVETESLNKPPFNAPKVVVKP